MATIHSHDLVLNENLALSNGYPLCTIHKANSLLYFCQCNMPICDACKNESHVGHSTEAIGMIIKPETDGNSCWTSLFPLRPMSYYINRRVPTLQSAKFTELFETFDKLETRLYPKTKLFFERKNEMFIFSKKHEVFVYEVEVQNENGLKVIEKNPELKPDFFKSQAAHKVIWIESKSVRIVESKQCVYNEFKDLIDLNKILIHHALENHDDLMEFVSSSTLQCLCNDLHSIIEGKVSEDCRKSIEEVKMKFDKEEMKDIASEVEAGKQDRSDTANKIAREILQKINLRLQKYVYNRLLKLCNEKDELFYRLEGELYKPISEILYENLKTSLFWDRLDKQCLTQTQQNRNDMIADVIYNTLNLNEAEEFVSKLREKVMHILESTLTDARDAQDQWEKKRCESVNEWTKTEHFARLKEFQPPVLSSIFGVKNKMTVLKVFISEKDAQVQEYVERECNRLGNVHPHFLDMSEEPKEAREQMKKLKELEQSLPPINQDTRKRLKNVLKEKAHKLLANHSPVVGLGISKVRQDGDKIVSEPCIVVYCLDKTLRPFGENQLPKYLGGCHLDIREDFVMLGHCTNCQSNPYPIPGCDIGRPNSISAGSMGFLVAKKSSENAEKNEIESGFLTAAHVAIDQFYRLYETQSLLHEIDIGNLQHEIVHPSTTNNVIGIVAESFCGNYRSENGLDIAYVKTHTPFLGEKVELLFPDESLLKIGGNMRVTKIGRTTGRTFGTLDDDSLLVCVDFDQGQGFCFFEECFGISERDNSFFEAGDSGSGVFLVDTNHSQNRPLGIAFARLGINRQTAVCKIKEFLDSLNLTVYQPV